MDYEPGTGSKQLFPKMHLETCGGPLSSARTTVELQTSHIGKGCDRETYSEKSLQKLCGWWPKLPVVNIPGGFRGAAAPRAQNGEQLKLSLLYSESLRSNLRLRGCVPGTR